MRCVFFSLVSKVKGAGLVLDAAKELPQVEFHFYGRVEEDFKDEFERRLAKLPNSSYHGVFDSVKDDVLAELNQYDLHLLPTSWPNEGVPGVLVETKMAAVPSIVSDCCHNAEIVRDGADGIVLDRCDAPSLVKAVRGLAEDPDRLDAMKASALASAERFYIDRYIGWIVQDLVA